MSKIIKLNYTKKVRYIFDKETEENVQLGDKVVDHFGSFLETPNCWYMADVKRFHKTLRECGLSIEEFLAKEFVMPQKTAVKPKRKPRKTVAKKSPVTKKKTTAKKKSSPKTIAK